MAANDFSSSINESTLTEVTADSAHFAGIAGRGLSSLEVDIDPFVSGDQDNQDLENDEDNDELNRNLLVLAALLPTVPQVDEMSIIDTTIESILQLQQKIHVLEQEVRTTGGPKAKFHSCYRSN